MKAKNLTALLFFLLISKVACCQVLVGATAGGNLSWMSFNDSDIKDLYDIKPVIGYHFGGHVAFRVQKRFFLHTSLIYSTKGVVMEGDRDDYEIEQNLIKFSMRLNYIEMPILYNAYFKGKIGTKVFKYSIGIGPNVSYWLGGKGTVDNSDIIEFGGEKDFKIAFNKDRTEGKEGEMVVENPNRIQLGINLGASFMFEPAPNREIFLTVRYEFGHSYLSRGSTGTFATTYYEYPLESTNQGFRLSLSYMIDLRVDQRKKGKSTNDHRKRKY
ncbi:MAG TPA: porin family protein [Ohtaekwangia sp.]